MTLNSDPILELGVFLNERGMKLLESLKLEIMNNQQDIDNLLYQKVIDSKITKDRCKICGSKEEQKDLQRHHPAGIKHDFRTETVCTNKCHRWLTERQDTWDRRWKNENLPDNLRKAFFLLGLQDMLILKSKMSGINIYERLAYSYNEKISTLLGDWQID